MFEFSKSQKRFCILRILLFLANIIFFTSLFIEAILRKTTLKIKENFYAIVGVFMALMISIVNVLMLVFLIKSKSEIAHRKVLLVITLINVTSIFVIVIQYFLFLLCTYIKTVDVFFKRIEKNLFYPWFYIKNCSFKIFHLSIGDAMFFSFSQFIFPLLLIILPKSCNRKILYSKTLALILFAVQEIFLILVSIMIMEDKLIALKKKYLCKRDS